MNTPTPSSTHPQTAVPDKSDSVLGAWNRFWFTPADPTVLALIRIFCAFIACWTMLAYTPDLQEFFGENAWLDLKQRGEFVRLGPVLPMTFAWEKTAAPIDTSTLTERQKQYIQEYFWKWGTQPPMPWPTSEEEAYAFDVYRAEWGYDPRQILDKGTPVWSLWFDVTDPKSMMVLHCFFLACLFLLAIGFCTRVTSVLSWFAFLNYIHRSPIQLFGVDTMTVIVLLYLCIAPCGATLSVDRLIAGWWAVHRPRVIASWWAIWDRLHGRTPVNPKDVPLGTPLSAQPRPTVSANVALRLLQIHVCIIYAAAGFSKLQGNSWWQGTAIWAALANYEFAPMANHWYQEALRALCSNRLVLEVFLTSGTLFTLFFEICYAFLIWRRSTRWLMLAMALVLHGVIGMFMGLKTFSLMMLTMNLAFVPPESIYWLFRRLKRAGTTSSAPAVPALATTAIRETPVPAAAAAAGRSVKVVRRKN